MNEKLLLDELLKTAKGELGEDWPKDAAEINKHLFNLSSNAILISTLRNENRISDETAGDLIDAQKNYAETIFYFALGITEMQAQSLVNALILTIIQNVIGAADWIIPG